MRLPRRLQSIRPSTGKSPGKDRDAVGKGSWYKNRERHHPSTDAADCNQAIRRTAEIWRAVGKSFLCLTDARTDSCRESV